MAGFFDFINGGSQNFKEDEKFQKNAVKIQDFINKYKIRSRDLNIPDDIAKETQLYAPGAQQYAWIDSATTVTNKRAIRYKEYREMTRVPELNQSLNIYADNATQYNVKNQVMEIQSNNNKVAEILEKLFFENLDMNSNLWNITRNVCKLGDEFLEVVVDNPDNPKHIISLERIKNPENMKRIEKDGVLIAFKYESDDDDGKKSKSFQPWQIIHFNIEDEEYEPYGKSVLEAGRQAYKKLSLMEDAMLVYRISRAPERRIFYIDVGTMPTKEANKFIETLKRQFRKKKYINPATGQVDEKANPLCITLDTKIPLLDGRTLNLKELISEHKEGKENWVYSINKNNKIVSGKIIWADVTRKNASLMKITLDNGKSIRCTPDHKFMMRDGSYIEAKYLKENDSLMPFYKKEEQVYNPKTGRYRYTHHIMMENISKLLIGKKYNYKSSKKWLNVPVKNYSYEYKNHKVAKAEWLNETEDTGDITIDIHHNFATDSGVFIHNSVDEDFYIPVRQNSQGTRIETLPPGCLTLDTKIDSLDGNSYSLLEMIEKYENGEEQWVYSTNPETGEISPGLVSWAGITNRNAEIMEIKLDNGETIRCTPDHKFPIWGKSFVEAKDLQVSDSIIAHNKKYDSYLKDYEMIYDHKKKCWIYTYRMIADSFKQTDSVNNKNVFNIEMDEELLTKFVNIFKTKKNYTETLKWINDNPYNEFTKYFIELNKNNTENLNPYKLTSTFTKRFMNYFGYENVKDFSNKINMRNHKVVSIKMLDYTEDVGTLTIDKDEIYHNYHTFALSCGIYTKNSNLGEIDDVKYFKDMILKTMGVPSGYLGGSVGGETAGTYDPKSYLSNQEIQFARTIERVQKFIIKGLEKIAFVELIFAKTEKEDIKDFKLKLTPPSNVDQLMEIEIRNQQFALIQQIRSLENFLPDEWIYSEVLGMSEHEIQKIRLQLQMQQQMQLQLQNLASSSGGGGMNMGTGGNIGGGNIMGGPAPSGEAGGPAPGGEVPKGDEKPELEVASQNMIEFDGGNWLMENTEDVKKLLKYVKLYEKVHKDNNTDKVKYEQQNSATRMLIEGEFRGLVKAYQSSNSIILREEKILTGKGHRLRHKKKASPNTSKKH